MKTEIPTDVLEKSVNRVIQVLEGEFKLTPIQVAFALAMAKDHVQEFHGFRLDSAVGTVAKCKIPGCQVDRVAYTQFCMLHQFGNKKMEVF